MENKFLPIGSIVLLKGASKKIMVTGFLCKEPNNEKIYDYVGCPYPEGMISFDTNLLFDNNQIDKVIEEGYKDNDEILYKQKLNELVDNLNK